MELPPWVWGRVLEIYIRHILAQCNRPKLSPACTRSLGFSCLYILMLGFIVTQVIVLHSYTITCVTINPNMSIYKRLNPRLLVQVGLGLGLLHWANICLIYISNTLPQTQGGSSMKTWGWISMRRSLGDALKNAFKETTMKNVSINQFRSFKWRNRVQNWNLHEKLSKIGPFENFDFWLNVNAKSQESTK